MRKNEKDKIAFFTTNIKLHYIHKFVKKKKNKQQKLNFPHACMDTHHHEAEQPDGF